MCCSYDRCVCVCVVFDEFLRVGKGTKDEGADEQRIGEFLYFDL